MLTRIHTDLTKLTDGAHPKQEWQHTDHPPLPSQRALDRLRNRVQSTWAKDHEPTTWWHRAGEAWAAVTDLHRAGHHDDAMALALLLAWCDSFPWEKASLWTLTQPVPADADTAGSPGQLHLLEHDRGEPLLRRRQLVIQPYYTSDNVTLYHGDCRDILPDLQPVDLVLTDPPYGINYVSQHNIGRGTTPITNDGARLSVALQRKVIPLLPAKHILWFTRWDVWPDIWSELGPWFPMRGLLVWDKGHPGMGDLKHWGPSYELIASAGSGQTVGTRDQSVLKYLAPAPHLRLHPTEKPVALLRYLIGKLDAQSVLDPFNGCGSTLAAAHEVGVPSIGIEINEENCEKTAKRLQRIADAPRLPFEDAS